jgi:hypothetical protein
LLCNTFFIMVICFINFFTSSKKLIPQPIFTILSFCLFFYWLKFSSILHGQCRI